MTDSNKVIRPLTPHELKSLTPVEAQIVWINRELARGLRSTWVDRSIFDAVCAAMSASGLEMRVVSEAGGIVHCEIGPNSVDPESIGAELTGQVRT
jgi:hypothetical protein